MPDRANKVFYLVIKIVPWFLVSIFITMLLDSSTSTRNNRHAAQVHDYSLKKVGKINSPKKEVIGLCINTSGGGVHEGLSFEIIGGGKV